MGGRFIPSGIQEEWDRFTPRFRNLFENVALVQFDHRMLAYTTVAAGTGLFVSAMRLAPVLPSAALTRAGLLAAVVWGQATVGVLTILCVKSHPSQHLCIALFQFIVPESDNESGSQHRSF